MEVTQIVQSNACNACSMNPRVKPAVPKKPVKLTAENDVKRTTHVRDMVRKLQEKERDNGIVEPGEPGFMKSDGKGGKIPPSAEKAETNVGTACQTLEDLKAIDEDIEKLRRQIEERDKIITALREAAEAKDKKLADLSVEDSKLRPSGGPETEATLQPCRAGHSPPFAPDVPPLCSGELRWKDGFVESDYSSQLLPDRAALQIACEDLRKKLGWKGGDFLLPEGEGAINLIMAEQIRLLKEREVQLIWEAEELREQNDLMEFRILELEECRKEFLDKEMANEGKHRAEKLVWRERDLEEVSDSGVVSLPTSEDLTSDSELGDAIRNYSPLGAVAHLGLPTSDSSHSDHGTNDLKLRKSLKSAECLQESGIFVDVDSSDCATSAGSHSKACQTESLLEKTLLDLIDSSCDLLLTKNPGYLEDLKSDDLTTEISKLSVIQRRIQQKSRTPTPRNPHAVVSCPHANSLLFYEERLGQLEDKLKIYESSGDAQGILLAKRLQKEVELSRRVKELTDKVASLEALNRKLEEEKCEFEEAENDARFQCQRLEVRLQELIDKNADLELEVERRKAMMSEEKRKEKKKGSLEGLLSKYEKRNFELEEKEIEAKKRLSMIEAAMPAIVAYNVFKMVQKPEFEGPLPAKASDAFLVGQKPEAEDPLEFEGGEMVPGEQGQEMADSGVVEESATDGEKALRNKIRKLEAKADQDRAALEEMTHSLKAYEAEKSERGGRFSRTDDVDLLEELKQMVANEIELRAQIERLEKKEQAYMQSLEKADEIWAGMEADYKRRLLEAEEANEELQKRISRLEKSRAELERILASEPSEPSEPDPSAPGDDFREKIRRLAVENEKLKAQIGRGSDEALEERRKVLEAENSTLKNELKKLEYDSVTEERKHQVLQMELELTKAELQRERGVGEKLRKDFEEKSQSVASMESTLQNQISILTQELSQKSKELTSLEVTVAELREEVETLENKVGELVETIQTMIKKQEEVSTAVKAARKFPGGAPGRPGDPSNTEDAVEKTSTADEISPKLEIPFGQSERRRRVTVSPVPFCSRQETRFVFARPECTKLVFMGTTERLLTSETPSIETQEKEIDEREEEIFQLSIKNTELQQTLERMDEESKVKDKEFEELQKVALEIRKEQENLLSAYVKSGQCRQKAEHQDMEGSAPALCYHDTSLSGDALSEEATGSIEFLQIINPIVIKTSEQVSNSLSSLQMAIDNLQSKYRWKSPQVKLNDSRDAEKFVKQLAIDSPAGVEPKEKNEGALQESSGNVGSSYSGATAVGEFHKPRPSTPLGLNTPVACPALVVSPSFRRLGQRTTEDVAEFSFAAPITTVRKVGDDGIFLEWDVAQQPESVVGFEIKVNGLLSHRVRSSTRNKALLRPLNLKEQISIHLFAMTKNGRSTRSSHVTFPNEFFLDREESLLGP